MPSGVCAVEWDGQHFISVTIDIYCFVFVVEDFDPFDLTLYRAFQRWQDGWIRPSSLDFEPRPDLVHVALKEATSLWHLQAMADGRSLDEQPARQLYYDANQEVFDRRADVARLIENLVHPSSRDAPLLSRPA